MALRVLVGGLRCPAARAGMPGYAGASPSAMIASAKASVTAGFMAVSSAAASAAGGAPARPLLTVQADLLVAAGGEQRVREARCCAPGLSSEAGSHSES